MTPIDINEALKCNGVQLAVVVRFVFVFIARASFPVDRPHAAIQAKSAWPSRFPKPQTIIVAIVGVSKPLMITQVVDRPGPRAALVIAVVVGSIVWSEIVFAEVAGHPHQQTSLRATVVISKLAVLTKVPHQSIPLATIPAYYSDSFWCKKMNENKSHNEMQMSSLVISKLFSLGCEWRLERKVGDRLQKSNISSPLTGVHRQLTTAPDRRPRQFCGRRHQ